MGFREDKASRVCKYGKSQEKRREERSIRGGGGEEIRGEEMRREGSRKETTMEVCRESVLFSLWLSVEKYMYVNKLSRTG